jgi:hypothetical protein
MEKAGILYAHLEYSVAIWYIFPPFGILCQENLATLTETKVEKCT